MNDLSKISKNGKLDIDDIITVGGGIFGDKIKIENNGSIDLDDLWKVSKEGKLDLDDIITIGGGVFGQSNPIELGTINMDDIIKIARNGKVEIDDIISIGDIGSTIKIGNDGNIDVKDIIKMSENGKIPLDDIITVGGGTFGTQIKIGKDNTTIDYKEITKNEKNGRVSVQDIVNVINLPGVNIGKDGIDFKEIYRAAQEGKININDIISVGGNGSNIRIENDGSVNVSDLERIATSGYLDLYDIITIGSKTIGNTGTIKIGNDVAVGVDQIRKIAKNGKITLDDIVDLTKNFDFDETFTKEDLERIDIYKIDGCFGGGKTSTVGDINNVINVTEEILGDDSNSKVDNQTIANILQNILEDSEDNEEQAYGGGIFGGRTGNAQDGVVTLNSEDLSKQQGFVKPVNIKTVAQSNIDEFYIIGDLVIGAVNNETGETLTKEELEKYVQVENGEIKINQAAYVKDDLKEKANKLKTLAENSDYAADIINLLANNLNNTEDMDVLNKLEEVTEVVVRNNEAKIKTKNIIHILENDKKITEIDKVIKTYEILEKNGNGKIEPHDYSIQEVANAALQVYREDSQPLEEAIDNLLKVTQNLGKEDVVDLAKALGSAPSIEELANVFGEYERRAASRPTPTDQTKNYVETLEPNALLFDETPYIEYSNKFQISESAGNDNVYWTNNHEMGLTIGVAGCVWKDAHSGIENDYDGIRGANANGYLEIGIPGVKVTLIDRTTNQKAFYWGQRRGSIYEKVPAQTYTDEGGYYHIEKLPVGEYDVEFEYDGQKYKTTSYLVGNNGNAEGYKNNPDLDNFDNDSKAVEDPVERQEFNDRFNEIINGYAVSKDTYNTSKSTYEYQPVGNKVNYVSKSSYVMDPFELEVSSTDGKVKTPLEYKKKEGISELITTHKVTHYDGYNYTSVETVMPKFAMHARTSFTGVTYPIDNFETLENFDTSFNEEEGHNVGEYMYHINLGLVERSKTDIGITQDVYTVRTTVNQKMETYGYDNREILGVYDYRLKKTGTYQSYKYTRKLYNADYKFRIDDYQKNGLNKLDRYGEDNKEIEEIVKLKTKKLDGAPAYTTVDEGTPNERKVYDLEEKVFVKYKIRFKNQSILQSVTLNEIVDYFDQDYKLVTEDTYLDIQGENTEGQPLTDLNGQPIRQSNGIPHSTLVAEQSYYERENGEKVKIKWNDTGRYYTDPYPGLKTIYTTDLKDIILVSNEEINIYVTFEVDKNKEKEIIKGDKRNIVEVTNYSTYTNGSSQKVNPEGLIDKDSEPGNTNPYKTNEYEDDTDEAPVLDIKLYEDEDDKNTLNYGRNGRIIDGMVWEDERTKLLESGQKVGDGIRDENEDRVQGVRVQLIEKIDDPVTGAEYEFVWKQMYTGLNNSNNYTYTKNSGSRTNTDTDNTSNGSNPLGFGDGNKVENGQYVFNDFIAGNFIVRFIYGDEEKTYLTNSEDSSVNKKLTEDTGGLNKVSYNGQDYKSTTYQLGTNPDRRWYDLGETAQNNKLMSDAKDDQARRQKVMEYSNTITNKNAEVLASFDARMSKNQYGDERDYYGNKEQQKALRDNTWMFADTSRFNIEGEYNTTNTKGEYKTQKSEEKENSTYRIKNIDFGIEERPETKIELNKEIIGIKVSTADSTQKSEVIIDTANGVNKNVNWTPKIKTEEISEEYKRKTKKYIYTQGKHGYTRYTQGRYHIYMDDEVMLGTNIQIDYKITISNTGEVDYIGKDGSLGVAYYQGRVDYNSDKIVTTHVDKILDYVDNSIVFRYENDAGDWQLIENWHEFKKDTDEAETNENVIKHMKELGYLNPDLNIVQTKSATTVNQPINQVIVTESLKDIELKPEESKEKNGIATQTEVYLTLLKTFSPEDDADTLSYRNVAEIIQLTNTAGRRDMDAIPGNQNPNVRDQDGVLPDEYDADVTEQVIITPPTGANKSTYYVLGVVGILIIIGTTIFIIKRKVVDKK